MEYHHTIRDVYILILHYFNRPICNRIFKEKGFSRKKPFLGVLNQTRYIVHYQKEVVDGKKLGLVLVYHNVIDIEMKIWVGDISIKTVDV